jgi:hypothetical protein
MFQKSTAINACETSKYIRRTAKQEGEENGGTWKSESIVQVSLPLHLYLGGTLEIIVKSQGTPA